MSGLGSGSGKMQLVDLRDVEADDIATFFIHQLDPEATRMAAFAARDEAAFHAHWEKCVGDDELIVKTILSGHEVAGNIGAWEEESGRLLVGYWIGREFWGKGIATAALAKLLEELKQRPLHARVATSNLGSIRVLEKCGFKLVKRERFFDESLGEEIEESLMKLT